jgi:uncharacterized protein YbbC (DUF1343 family)
MIEFGIDSILQQNPNWKKQRIGFVTNHAATTNSLEHSRKALLENGFNIVCLFSPEHGLDVKGEDGAFIENGIDTLTQLPIVSLYGNKLAPTKEDVANLDYILFDIPDIGCRFYTYLWTLTHVLEACAKLNKPLIILDRPNPISGDLVNAEGPILNEETCSSFIGRWAMPLRHACTLGELALFFNTTKLIGTTVEVIQCKQWQRHYFQPNWHMKFVPTSPAMQHFEAALLYPGLGLLEATNISEGRGTQKAFEVVGAPWLQHEIVCSIFNELQDNVLLFPTTFIPNTSKYVNELCYGVGFTINNVATFQPVYTALLLVQLIKQLHPEDFKWTTYPTLVNPNGTGHLDKLLGIENSEVIFELPMQSFLQKIEQITFVGNWQQIIEPYLLYE